ncbi:hypothetical protein U9M48_040255, partial [Paspalum notatum var. saurae]
GEINPLGAHKDDNFPFGLASLSCRQYAATLRIHTKQSRSVLLPPTQGSRSRRWSRAGRRGDHGGGVCEAGEAELEKRIWGIN